MAKSFHAQIKDFATMTERNLNYVMKSAITDVLVAAQTTQIGITRGATSFEVGKLPVGKTRQLVNSLTVDNATGPDAYVTAILGMQIGDVKRFAWTAPHAMHVEVGTSKMAGRHFVGTSAAMFSGFVAKRAAEVRS